jgi:hypothetical protein
MDRRRRREPCEDSTSNTEHISLFAGTIVTDADPRFLGESGYNLQILSGFCMLGRRQRDLP